MDAAPHQPGDALGARADEAAPGRAPGLHLELPGLRGLARHALPALLEGTIAPVVVFLVALHVLGWRGAIVAGLVWCYGNVARRVVTRQRVPGVLVLGALTLTARAAIGLASGSTFVYFLQPTLGTALVGLVFLASASLGRPLVQRLASDFCPIPSHFLDNHHVRRFFLQITILWAFTQLASAAIALWLLATQSVEQYVIARTAVSLVLSAAAIGASTLWFHRSMARGGILVRWRPNLAGASR